MRNATEITIVGNLTADPELRFTPSGAPVANFSVVVNTRRFDKRTDSWTDGEATFWRCTLWRQTAENVAESLTRGMRVVVIGRVESRSWEDRTTGEKRTSLELQVDEIGASLAFATVKVTKVERSSRSAGGGAGDDEPPF
jgi:single-strand DNA-binding protein